MKLTAVYCKVTSCLPNNGAALGTFPPCEWRKGFLVVRTELKTPRSSSRGRGYLGTGFSKIELVHSLTSLHLKVNVITTFEENINSKLEFCLVMLADPQKD